MLKAQYLVSVDLLEVFFDEPLPLVCEEHPEFVGFMELLRKTSKHKILRHGELLAGFSVPYGDFIRTCAVALPAGQRIIHEKLRDALTEMPLELGEGLQVNFHQKSFDTTERFWNFVLNQGYFCQHIFNRIAWYMAPRNAIVTDYPLHVDIESANTCNMNCPMCYRDQMKHIGQMEVDLFKSIVDQCAVNDLYSMRLSWRGETLSHPRIKEMIAYAASKIPNVSFLTNAFYIDDAFIDNFIESRLAYVAVSFDGIDKVYEAVRHPAKYEESRARIAHLKKRREAVGADRPQIRLSTVWPAVRQAPDAYRQAMTPVSDYMAYNPYINFKGELRLKENFICQYPWERIVIAFDGQAQCCTGWNAGTIILGNVREKTVRDMWHSQRMHDIRATHQAGRRLSIDSCADCRHGSVGEANADIWAIVKRRY
jgi:radical SAM protein with 4Fe4S-binding SPASM domain